VHLSVGPLRYTWLRYLGIRLNFSGFFQNLGIEMRMMLRNSPVVETAKGEMVKPLLARYVPPSQRGQDNTPLTLGPMTESKYLSQQYADSDSNLLKNLHVQTLSDEDFLYDLQQLLAHGVGAAKKSELWHARIAEVLIGLWRNDQHRKKIKELPLIPVNGGTWVSASTGNLFFPGSEDCIALGDLGISFIDQDATQNDGRKSFFRILGINVLSDLKLQSLILEKHSKTYRSLLPTRHTLVSHAVFLFRTRWSAQSHRGNYTPFWVVTTTGDYLEVNKVYLNGAWKYSSHPCFAQFRGEFPFLHADYDSVVEPEEKSRWLDWLREQLGVQDVSRITPRLQELIVEEHYKSGPTDLPAQDLLIAHATFLFQTKWSSQKAHGAFYVVSEEGAYVHAQDVYLDTTTQQSFGQYFHEFRRRFQFLHIKYYSAVEPEEKSRWLDWLRKQLGVQHVSRITPRLQKLIAEEHSKSDPTDLPDQHPVGYVRQAAVDNSTVEKLAQALPDMVDSIGDSGYASRETSSQAPTKNVASIEEPVEEDEDGVDNETLYSVDSVLPKSRDMYIDEFSRRLAEDIRQLVASTETPGLAFPSSTPALLKSFARRLHGEASSKPEREASVFLHKHRVYVH
jgi:hypothetical protein